MAIQDEYDTLLSEAVESGVIQGTIYNKLIGYDSLDRINPLKPDAVLKFASATKLITSIALLQCVERGLIGLDDPLEDRILPELRNRQIIAEQVGELVFRPASGKITARHLLSHTSGLGYRFLDPKLVRWASSEEPKARDRIVEKFDLPLLFEPGVGWAYGCSLDWAGVAVRRLSGENISLEAYMIENIWKRVGRKAPWPTFSISRDPDYKSRLMLAGKRNTQTGGLEPYDFALSDSVDEEGGHGMSMTVDDYVAVLQDLIMDEPKLLSRETINLMFQPQLEKGSPALPMLERLRPAWDLVAGPADMDDVNHGLGGLLIHNQVEAISQPGDLLAWGGALNLVWFVSTRLGVAGLFATQITPFGDAAVKRLVDRWKLDFWSQFLHT